MKPNVSPHIHSVRESALHMLETIPSDILVLAAAKTRSMDEVEAVIQAGITHIGYNYVQEALPIIQSIGRRATWHMIGHLQQNKVKTVVQYFDMIETIDSLRLAQIVDRQCAATGKTMPVLVEVNSGREANKTGILPEDVETFVIQISTLKNIRVEGLMTMGPRFGDPEDARSYFKATRAVFEHLAAMELSNPTMRYLSMGMSNSYLVAIEEGANLIRIGTKLFGVR